MQQSDRRSAYRKLLVVTSKTRELRLICESCDLEPLYDSAASNANINRININMVIRLILNAHFSTMESEDGMNFKATLMDDINSIMAEQRKC